MAIRISVVLVYLAITFLSIHGFRIDEWGIWKAKYGKTYSSIREDHKHRSVWEKNVNYVEEHNKRSDVTFKLEVNSFADEIMSRSSILIDTSESSTLVFQKTSSAPDSWDWRVKGAVKPVRNQGQQGEVFSIAATECVESFNIIKTGKLSSLSYMETRDCCGQQQLASTDIFQCIHRIGGLCSEADYPKSQGKCMNNSCNAVATIAGGKLVPKGDEEALKEAVYIEPVMAFVDASHPSFQLYRSGVYAEPRCSAIRLDHALQIVGYGSMNGQEYWICKNSWGVSWGMKGYILIARNKGNMCGIATMASYPD